MRTEKITVEVAVQKGRQLPWAMLRSYSSVYLGATPDAVDTDRLIEARFFSETCEIRIFREDGKLAAVLLEEESGDKVAWHSHRISNPKFGGSLTVARVLAFDDDGQAYVITARLAGWKEA